MVVVAVEGKGVGVPFPATTRWLRGRLLSRVTAAPAGTWVELPDRLGQHDSDAIAAAAQRLELEGFIEVRGAEARVRA
jgi:hypothetical protein